MVPFNRASLFTEFKSGAASLVGVNINVLLTP